MPRLSYRRRLMLRKLLRVLGIVLAAAIVLCGLFSDPIITLLAKLSAGVM